MRGDVYIISSECCSAHNHNITHNLGPMLREAGLDWHDYEGDNRSANQLMHEAAMALTLMVDDPERFRALNPSNGWGNYEGALAFLARLVVDCARHPEARVEVSL